MFAKREAGISKIVMNTIIAGSAAGLVGTFFKPWLTGYKNQLTKGTSAYDVGSLSNGLLCGLVGITGVCDAAEPWGALIIGLVAGFVYGLACKLCEIITVDDPIEASPVHGFGGMWGLIAVGIFHNEKGLLSGADEGKAKFFFVQIGGMFVIILWVAFLSGLYFLVMNKFKKLRVSLLDEVIGLDIAEMGGVMHINRKVNDKISRADSIR